MDWHDLRWGLRDQKAGDGAMSHAIAAITGRDQQVLVAARIDTDEAERMHRLHHLAGPPIRKIVYRWKPFAGPFH